MNNQVKLFVDFITGTNQSFANKVYKKKIPFIFRLDARWKQNYL